MMTEPANNNTSQKKSEIASGKTDQAEPAQNKTQTQTKKATTPKKGTKKQTTVKETVKRKSKTANQKQKKTDRRPVTSPTTTKPFTEDIMTTAKSQMEKIMEDAGSVNKEGLDTFMKAGNRFMKGMEEIMKLSMTQAQKTAEKNSKTMKDLMACKTVNEFTEAQTKAAQDNFDEFMKSMSKLSELSVKVTSDCFEPVNDQFSKTIKKANENMAA